MTKLRERKKECSLVDQHLEILISNRKMHTNNFPLKFLYEVEQSDLKTPRFRRFSLEDEVVEPEYHESSCQTLVDYHEQKERMEQKMLAIDRKQCVFRPPPPKYFSKIHFAGNEVHFQEEFESDWTADDLNPLAVISRHNLKGKFVLDRGKRIRIRFGLLPPMEFPKIDFDTFMDSYLKKP